MHIAGFQEVIPVMPSEPFSLVKVNSLTASHHLPEECSCPLLATADLGNDECSLVPFKLGETWGSMGRGSGLF